MRAVEAEASGPATAAKYDVSPSLVIKLMQRWPRRGTVQPDLTIAELRTRLAAEGIAAAARSVEVLWRTIGQLLDAFSPAECAHYLAHAGYVPSNREPLSRPPG